VSSGSPFAIAAFWCQKAGNGVEEYEDAWSVRQVEETAGCRVAIADGATESSYSKIWATLLVESYIRDSVTGPEFFDGLEGRVDSGAGAHSETARPSLGTRQRRPNKGPSPRFWASS
jgi:hypothetical protein